MARIVDKRSALDSTVRIYDDFYSFKLSVSTDEYDVVRSYFVSACEQIQTAENFTVFLFRIASATGIPVIELLDYIKGKTGLELNATIAYYLNSFKARASLYGISQIPLSNQYVARNVVQ